MAVTADSERSPEAAGASVLERLTVPGAPEFLEAMEAAGNVRWSLLQGELPATPPSGRAEIALVLGKGFTEAFLAGRTGDARRFRTLYRELTELAERLGVAGPLQARTNSVNGFAERGYWDALALELEAALNETTVALERQRDEAFPLLISMGAWVRAMQLAADAEQQDEVEPGHLLHQPEVVRYFRNHLGELPDRWKVRPLIRHSETTLEELAPMLESGTPDQSQAGRMREILAAWLAFAEQSQ